jgi:hypothetical protein
VGALHRHAQAGRLDPVELDERVERALTAKTFGELEELIRDLPDETRTPQARALAQRTATVAKLREHIGAWVSVAVITTAIWAVTGADYFWPIWPIGIIGVTVILHVVDLLKGGSDQRTRSTRPSGARRRRTPRRRGRRW